MRAPPGSGTILLENGMETLMTKQQGSDHLFFQFSVKHEQKLDCGGGYMKLLSGEVDRRNLVVIPRTVSCLDQISVDTAPRKFMPFLTTKKQTTWSRRKFPRSKLAVCTPDWDLLPPKQIKDPEAKKPEDWDDKEYIPDPEDKEARGRKLRTPIPGKVEADPKIDNPGEIWNLVSSNVLVSDDPEYAKQQWLKKHGKSRKMYAEKAAFGRRQKKKKRMRGLFSSMKIILDGLDEGLRDVCSVCFSCILPEDEDETDDVEGEIPMPKLKKTRTARTKKKYMMSCDEKHSRQQLGMEEIHLGSKC
uniref:Uncharacterized protein n=1 Tax=Populus alba TaxID=43335 RepID=A0A4U5QRX8_POPAL|nr:hypothetical protein D5086_0000049640 [Populus alba]